MNKVGLLLLILVSVGNVIAGNPVKVFIIAGQSNAAGSGGLEDSFPDEYLNPLATTVKMWVGGRIDNDGELDYSWDRDAYTDFVTLQPGSGNYLAGNTSGCELSLGYELEDMFPDNHIVIIKYGMSGSALYRGLRNEGAGDWCPDVTQNGTFEGIRYRIFKNSALLPALQSLNDAGLTYELAAMFWIQGETDAANLVAAEAYNDNLENLINNVREDLNCPDMPFFTAKMNVGVRPYASQVNLAMDSIAVAMNNVYSIYIGDVDYNSDNIHYSAAGQVDIGLRFANSYKNHEQCLVVNQLQSFDDLSGLADMVNIVFDDYVPDSGVENGVNLNNSGTFTGFVDGINGREPLGLLVDGSDNRVVFADYYSDAITSDIAAGQWGNATFPDSGRSVTFTFVDTSDITINQPVSRVSFEVAAVDGDNVNVSFIDNRGGIISTISIPYGGMQLVFSCVNSYGLEVNSIYKVVISGDAGVLWTIGHAGIGALPDFSFGRIKCVEFLRGDLNRDCDVDLIDIGIIAEQWLETTKL